MLQIVIPLDTEENHILAGISGVIVKHQIRFEQSPRWNGKDQDYEIKTVFHCSENIYTVSFSSENMSAKSFYRSNKRGFYKWEDLKEKYGLDTAEELGKKLDIFSACPQTAEQLGEVWTPFSEDMDLSLVWEIYMNNFHEKKLVFNVKNYGCLSLDSIFDCLRVTETAYVYKGIVAGQKEVSRHSMNQSGASLFLLDGEWKPAVEVNRARITGLPLKPLTAICAILDKNEMNHDSEINNLMKFERITLEEWRSVRESSTGRWIDENLNIRMRGIMYKFQRRRDKDLRFLGFHYLKQVLEQYALAYLQDHYFMTINYEEGQIFMFHKKQKEDFQYEYDKFPPMMFCKAASAKSCNYICHKKVAFRRGITMDHPFICWLLANAAELRLYLNSQFQLLVEYFCQRDAEDIIHIYNVIYKQVCSVSKRYGLNIRDMPQLAMSDFWTDEQENE